MLQTKRNQRKGKRVTRDLPLCDKYLNGFLSPETQRAGLTAPNREEGVESMYNTGWSPPGGPPAPPPGAPAPPPTPTRPAALDQSQLTLRAGAGASPAGPPSTLSGRDAPASASQGTSSAG